MIVLPTGHPPFTGVAPHLQQDWVTAVVLVDRLNDLLAVHQPVGKLRKNDIALGVVVVGRLLVHDPPERELVSDHGAAGIFHIRHSINAFALQRLEQPRSDHYSLAGVDVAANAIIPNRAFVIRMFPSQRGDSAQALALRPDAARLLATVRLNSTALGAHGERDRLL